ncbi:sentrin-specific protease 7 [Plakobranchus ocellatus]|uniref:Sentrin-specific protease 7 n=1 Tax=Plakobranchus ocellatus TaxID=259542 RepID=A0AAV4B5I2_9GAST|nr:sentrin-specific protease 7 [Plakobranchus ocellatus]
MQTVSATPLLDEVVKYFGIASMIAYGVTTTGMYFNPAMATGHMLGCKGTAVGEHFFVYWAGPFVGSFAGYMLNRMIHIDVTTRAGAQAGIEKDKQKVKKDN